MFERFFGNKKKVTKEKKESIADPVMVQLDVPFTLYPWQRVILEERKEALLVTLQSQPGSSETQAEAVFVKTHSQTREIIGFEVTSVHTITPVTQVSAYYPLHASPTQPNLITLAKKENFPSLLPAIRAPQPISERTYVRPSLGPSLRERRKQ